MADKDGTPKLLIEAQSLFGGQKTEVVQVDTNRLDPIAQAKQSLIAAFIHPSAIDAIGDAACWFCGAAFLTTVYLHTPLLVVLQVPILLVIITASGGSIAALFSIPELTFPILFRYFLFIAGCIVGAL